MLGHTVFKSLMQENVISRIRLSKNQSCIYIYYCMIIHLFFFHKVVYVVRVCAEPWYLYKMLTQNMLRTHERKWAFQIRFVPASDLLNNALNRSNDKDYFL